MYEHHKQPLASPTEFARRVTRNAVLTAAILLVSLTIGVLGYHFLGRLAWIDALLNASMILGGMGPVDAMQTSGGKLFASAYALYSGVVLLASVGVLAAPILHRFLHHFHLAEEE